MMTSISELLTVLGERREAEELLAHVLGCRRMALYMQWDRPVDEAEAALFLGLVKRRKGGEPIGYLIGEVPFYGAQIRVDRRVLIPRPETELLVDLVAQQKPVGTLVDLCTGSGCIAIALKKKFPELRVIGVDLSEEALAVARENGQKNGVEVEWRQGDFLEAVKGEKVDFLVSNPPYVTEGEWEALDPSVRDFEPKMALVGGLSFYERLRGWQGKFFLEIGASQGAEIQKMFPGSTLHRDWTGRDRFISLEAE